MPWFDPAPMMNQRNRLFTLLAMLAFALVLTAGNCGEDLEKNPDLPGSDGFRQNAEEVALGTSVIGVVDTKAGDSNDWKYFIVPSVGVVTITVTFDQHDAYCEMVLTDERGQTLSTFQDEKRQLLDKITIKAEPGKYFVRIFAKDGDSDYTLTVTFDPLL